uniref:three component ABC system middle component n=1 Tax=Methylobacterium sp. B34 TaxID=95563 RepID=UPI0005B25E4F|nr:three component ABC system middle component [Methylobacterium sp. B34]
MRDTHDVYAETNPAFCAAVLVEFTKAYMSERPSGPEAPVAYLALPVALSGELAGAFDKTNKRTGLLEWLERSPQVQVGLADRVNASLDIVSDAIRFGCFTRLLAIGAGARLSLGDKKLKSSAINALGEEPGQAIKRAGRLGHWFAAAGSTRSVFGIMGLTV